MRWQFTGSNRHGRSPASIVPKTRCVGSSVVSPISRSRFIAAHEPLRNAPHQALPWPSIVPSPVMATSETSWP